jgi:hypothetical protein
MPHSRIYRRAPDGHIEGPADLIECDNDAAALNHAREKPDGHGVEVWEGTRLVGVIFDDSF